MFQDHKVDFRREEIIAARATELREAVGLRNAQRLYVVSIIYKLRDADLLNKGRLTLKVYTDRPKGKRAFVSFNPLTLHVERRTLEMARWKFDPESTYILSHEVGHIILHNHLAKPFSEAELKLNRFGLEEYSAEWQADTFADHLLLPDHVVAQFNSIDAVLRSCSVERGLAEKRFRKKKSVLLFSASFCGDACPDCFNFTLTRKGSLLECHTCGASISAI